MMKPQGLWVWSTDVTDAKISVFQEIAMIAGLILKEMNRALMLKLYKTFSQDTHPYCRVTVSNSIHKNVIQS